MVSRYATINDLIIMRAISAIAQLLLLLLLLLLLFIPMIN